MESLRAVLALLAIGLPLALIARRLGTSALIAYLIAGVIIGPHGWRGGLIGERELGPLPDIGASLLLFSLGLELDLETTRRRLRRLAVSASAQMGLTLAAGMAMAIPFGLPWRPAMAAACCLTMSSTLVVLRALDERGLRERDEGQAVVGMLLAQDLCLAPMLVAVPLLIGRGNLDPWRAATAAACCLAATLLLRRALATPLIARVRSAQLPELEVAFAVTVALGAAALTQWSGLGTAAGAFCAGLALGGEEHRTAIESSTRPLQGLMAIVFFAGIGATLDLDYVASHPLPVLGGLAACLVIKAVLAALALNLAGLGWRAAAGCGVMAAQMGEFSFVLAGSAFAGDDATRSLHNLIISVTCLSLAATPLLVRMASTILPPLVADQVAEEGTAVVVAGLGHDANTIIETLHALGYPLFLIDRNPRLLAPWQGAARVRCHQGRIEHLDEWLPALGSRPRLVVLAFPVADTCALVASRLRARDPALVIVARSPYRAQVDALRNAGAQYVLCDEKEIARALLPILDQALAAATPTPRPAD